MFGYSCHDYPSIERGQVTEDDWQECGFSLVEVAFVTAFSSYQPCNNNCNSVVIQLH